MLWGAGGGAMGHRGVMLCSLMGQMYGGGLLFGGWVYGAHGVDVGPV